METTTQCPSVKVLRDLIDGRLVDPELSEYSSHLEHCADCQNRIQTFFPSDSLVRTLRNDASAQDTISEKISPELIDALKRIPAMDSHARLSADGLTRNNGMSLDDLGLSFLTPPRNPDEIGRLGHYRVLQVLGRGGMGAVFLAEDPKLGRRVALKVMWPKIASIQAARSRFLREAKAAASLKNDHIVTIYQVDEINNVPFLAMELLQGESLEQSLQRGRHFSIAETICIARDIARGLRMRMKRVWSIAISSPEISGWSRPLAVECESKFWTSDWLARKSKTSISPSSARSSARQRLWHLNRLARIARSTGGPICFRWAVWCTCCALARFRLRRTRLLAR